MLHYLLIRRKSLQMTRDFEVPYHHASVDVYASIPCSCAALRHDCRCSEEDKEGNLVSFFNFFVSTFDLPGTVTQATLLSTMKTW